MKQFEEPLGKKVDTVTIGKTRVTYAQAHGTFMSGRPFGPKTPNPGYGLLAAIIEGKGGAVFIKMTGPKAAVEANIEKTKKNGRSKSFRVTKFIFCCSPFSRPSKTVSYTRG